MKEAQCAHPPPLDNDNVIGTGEPREKPQGGGVFIWASLKITQQFQIKTPPLIFCFFSILVYLRKSEFGCP